MTSHYYDLQIKRYSLTTLSELAHYLEEIAEKKGDYCYDTSSLCPFFGFDTGHYLYLEIQRQMLCLEIPLRCNVLCNSFSINRRSQ